MLRRGHVPTYLLVIEGLVLFLVAWFSLLSFDEQFNNQSGDIALLSSNSAYNRAYAEGLASRLVVRAINRDFSDLNSSLKSSAQEFFDFAGSNGNILGKIRNGNYTISAENGIYTLNIEDVFVSSQVGQNKIVNEFDISVRFNDKGLM